MDYRELAETMPGIFKIPEPWREMQLRLNPFSGDEFSRLLRVRRYRGGADDPARDILRQPGFTPCTRVTTAHIAIVSNIALGFPAGAWYRGEVLPRAKRKFGLEKCLHAVAPELRRSYGRQPRNEKLVVVTDPITDSFGRPSLFTVAAVGGSTVWRWLSADAISTKGSDDGDEYFEGDTLFVFTRSRSAPTRRRNR